MSNEVSPMQSIQEKVQDRIKAEFVNLIPDDVWEQMIASVVNDFTTDKTRQKDSYGREIVPVMAPLKQIIHDAIEQQAKDAIKSKIEKYTHVEWGQHGEATINAALKKMVEENFESMLHSVNAGLVNTIVHTAMQNLRNGLVMR